MRNMTQEDVRQFAERLHIELTDEEAQAIKARMQNLYPRIEKLHALNTEGVTPLSHVLPLENVMRDDEVRPSAPRDAALANAPETEDGQVKVPATFEM